MKTILMAASALSLIAAPAFAQDASSTVNLAGTVAEQCGEGNHISGIAMTDAEGQFNGYVSGNRSFGNMWCNTAANVALTVTPFSTGNSTTDTGSFANSFDVRVTTNTSVYWNNNIPGGVVETAGSSVMVDGDTGGAFETGLGQYSGMIVEILPVIGSGGNPKRPVAGDYTGSITLTASIS